MSDNEYFEPSLEQEYKLDPESELRFEVEDGSKVLLVLKGGFAEVFGTELVINERYTFRSNAKISVFTWHGCRLDLVGRTAAAYVSKETPMVIFANIYAAIEQMRQNCDINRTKGPTVMVTGPTDVGKSTLCRILLNYAARQGRKPVFVDLDVGQGNISVPGTVGALLIERPADVEEGFQQQSPLVYHYGHKSPGQNILLYNTLVSRVSEVIRAKSKSNAAAFVSGMIINTCGWVKGEGYRSITHAALAFEVDVILVLAQERFYYQLCRDVPRFVKVVFVPRSGGAVERSRSDRIESRDNRVKEYFYGLKRQLYPHTFEVSFNEIQIHKIVTQAPTNSDTQQEDGQLRLVPVNIGFYLVNRIIGVSFASSLDEDVIRSHVAGFICITNMNTERRVITILSPHAPPLPRAVFIMSDIFLQDTH